MLEIHVIRNFANPNMFFVFVTNDTHHLLDMKGGKYCADAKQVTAKIAEYEALLHGQEYKVICC